MLQERKTKFQRKETLPVVDFINTNTDSDSMQQGQATTGTGEILYGHHNCNETPPPNYCNPIPEALSNNVLVNSQTSCERDNEKLIKEFTKRVSVGPDYVCSCCTQTFFGYCMTNANAARIQEGNKVYMSQFLTKYQSVDGLEWICRGCYDFVKARKIPKFWIKKRSSVS